MLTRRDPYDAYQRVEFDARVKGATSSELVRVCYDQLILSLSTAVMANSRGDAELKSRSLTRALTSIMALQMGIDHDHEMAGALEEFYGAARKSILASAVAFDADGLGAIREDFEEIRNAMSSAGG